MDDKIAGDGVPFGRIDRMMIWLLPGFLAVAGASVGGNAPWRYVLVVGGAVAGIAVVRGIEAALNVQPAVGTSEQANLARLTAVSARSQELLSQGVAQLDQLQALALAEADRDKAFSIGQQRAMLTVEESRHLAALVVAELQALRADQRQAKGEHVARFSSWAAWAAAVAATASAAVPFLRP